MSVTVEGGENIGKLEDIFKNAQEHALRAAAAHLEGKVKEKFTDNDWQPLKPATIKQKGSSRPLIDTGKLRASITHKVDGDIAKVGVFGEEALIASVHEFGAPAANIPERSFLRSTYNIEKKEIEKIIAEKFKEAVEESGLK